LGNKLYGMTASGGASGDGLIFSIDTNGADYTIVFSFNTADGATPYGSLLFAGNKLYGMTYYGGSGTEGVVFSIDTDGVNFTDLLNFNNVNGELPDGSLIFSGNSLYGMTGEGGANRVGLIFSIDTDGADFTDMFNFNSTPGDFPTGSLTYESGVLYGMTQQGGTYDDGVIFRLKDTNISTSSSKLASNVGATRFYPNPNNGIFTIQSSVIGGQSSLEIYNVLGEQVYSKNYPLSAISNQPISIDLSSQPSGIYLYRVIANSGELLGEGKMVIQK
jgi:uncharacterized repeat protein (TIGR03803 family)